MTDTLPYDGDAAAAAFVSGPGAGQSGGWPVRHEACEHVCSTCEPINPCMQYKVGCPLKPLIPSTWAQLWPWRLRVLGSLSQVRLSS